MMMLAPVETNLSTSCFGEESFPDTNKSGGDIVRDDEGGGLVDEDGSFSSSSG